MTDNPYECIGEVPPTDDSDVRVHPRAGDVCRITDEPELWIPYDGIGNQADGGVFRFARYPAVDRVESFDVSRICQVVVPCEDEYARDAWARIERKLLPAGTFDKRMIVFRAHGGLCATVVWAPYGREVFSGLHRDMADARLGIDSSIPPNVELVWCVGRDALQAEIASGRLVNVRFED